MSNVVEEKKLQRGTRTFEEIEMGKKILWQKALVSHCYSIEYFSKGMKDTVYSASIHVCLHVVLRRNTFYFNLRY